MMRQLWQPPGTKGTLTPVCEVCMKAGLSAGICKCQLSPTWSEGPNNQRQLNGEKLSRWQVARSYRPWGGLRTLVKTVWFQPELQKRKLCHEVMNLCHEPLSCSTWRMFVVCGFCSVICWPNLQKPKVCLVLLCTSVCKHANHMTDE